MAFQLVYGICDRAVPPASASPAFDRQEHLTETLNPEMDVSPFLPLRPQVFAGGPRGARHSAAAGTLRAPQVTAVVPRPRGERPRTNKRRKKLEGDRRKRPKVKKPPDPEPHRRGGAGSGGRGASFREGSQG